jgi:large subunit ribosomal protein L35
MPKMKTKKGAAKRFAMTGTGRIKHKKQNRRHILTNKAAKRKRHLRETVLVAKADEANIKRLLPYG